MNKGIFESYKRRLIFKYGLLFGLIALFSFRMAFMNLSKPNTDPLIPLSLENFGYQDELPPSSRFTYEFNYDCYYHFLEGLDGAHLYIEVRNYSTEQGSSYAYEKEWKKLKEYEQELHGRQRCSECKIMRSSKDNVFDYLVELDKEQWSSDLAYAIYDYHESLPENGYYEHCVMLVRDTYLYRITFTESFEMTDDNIAVIVDWYDEFESIMNNVKRNPM